eukprot:1155333-Pelagomonas_calceolata.AAC.7
MAWTDQQLGPLRLCITVGASGAFELWHLSQASELCHLSHGRGIRLIAPEQLNLQFLHPLPLQPLAHFHRTRHAAMIGAPFLQIGRKCCCLAHLRRTRHAVMTEATSACIPILHTMKAYSPILPSCTSAGSAATLLTKGAGVAATSLKPAPKQN